MKGFPTSLSKDIIAQVNGYERREMEGDRVKYYIKADKARRSRIIIRSSRTSILRFTV
jgi:hypothetical protein